MRPLESVTLVLLAAAWASHLVPGRPRWALWLLPVPALAAVLQLALEGYRWTMMPAYALAALFLIEGLVAFLRRGQPAAPAGLGRRILGVLGMVLALLVLALAAVLPVELPEFRLATPTGQYGIGTTTFELVDASRQEIYPPGSTAHRDLMIQAWYPAQVPAGAKPEPYWTKPYGPYWAYALSVPTFTFDYVYSIPTHSYKDAPLAGGEPAYPVLIFSPGAGGSVDQSTSQMEELASHGYVIFGISHPYEDRAIFYPDGRVVPDRPDLPGIFPPEPQAEIVATHARCVAMGVSAQADACWRHFIDLSPSGQSGVSTWTQDTRFVLDELARINQGERPSQFSGRLDLAHIGLFGHSLGGATSGEVCSQDSRCKAGVNMDGFQYGHVIDHPVPQPFMMMYSEDNVASNDFMVNQVKSQAYRVFIKGSRHQNYTDAGLELGAPIGHMVGYVGTIDGQRMELILNSYLVAFFDKHLKGIPSPLLDGPNPAYPEVDFQSRSGSGS